MERKASKGVNEAIYTAHIVLNISVKTQESGKTSLTLFSLLVLLLSCFHNELFGLFARDPLILFYVLYVQSTVVCNHRGGIKARDKRLVLIRIEMMVLVLWLSGLRCVQYRGFESSSLL